MSSIVTQYLTARLHADKLRDLTLELSKEANKTDNVLGFFNGLWQAGSYDDDGDFTTQNVNINTNPHSARTIVEALLSEAWYEYVSKCLNDDDLHPQDELRALFQTDLSETQLATILNKDLWHIKFNWADEFLLDLCQHAQR
jgi:hypothetical protein